jgi:asparagine synthase (glutamine-hydrolysing)
MFSSQNIEVHTEVLIFDMCGICGVYGDNTPSDSILQEMTETLQHRGPNSDGFYQDSSISLGMRRLSIIDLEGGDQPIHNEDESVWTVFNGEIYNYQSLRNSLEDSGHTFYTDSDTEVIVHLYEEHGPSFVERLNGMFALSVWDNDRERLVLARDRMGIKPLYYAPLDDRLVFGSEIKCILTEGTIDPVVDQTALHQYVGYEYVPTPRTILEGVQKLPPAHVLVADSDGFKTSKYWDFSFESKKTAGVDHLIEEVLNALDQAVERRLISDVPLGAFLSGGIDSSLMVALMDRHTDGPVSTFSIGFDDKSYNELSFAQTVADRFSTDHHEQVLTDNDVLELIEDGFVEYLDDPIADTSIFPTYLVSQMASNDVTVALSGDGSDELFAGYERYRASRIANYYERIPKSVRRPFEIPILSLSPRDQKRGLVNMGQRFVEGTRLPQEGHHIRWQYFIPPAERNRLYGRKLRDHINEEPLKLVDEMYKKSSGDDQLDHEQYVSCRMYLVDDILPKVDRMSMANSLEARVPYLDHKFVETVAQVPSSYRLKGLTTKYILKKAAEQLLPKEIVHRQKQGFSVPMKQWLRGDLETFMREILDITRIRRQGYFDSDRVSEMMNAHVAGRANYQHQLWAIMVFQLWHQKYLE